MAPGSWGDRQVVEHQGFSEVRHTHKVEGGSGELQERLESLRGGQKAIEAKAEAAQDAIDAEFEEATTGDDNREGDSN